MLIPSWVFFLHLTNVCRSSVCQACCRPWDLAVSKQMWTQWSSRACRQWNTGNVYRVPAGVGGAEMNLPGSREPGLREDWSTKRRTEERPLKSHSPGRVSCPRFPQLGWSWPSTPQGHLSCSSRISKPSY